MLPGYEPGDVCDGCKFDAMIPDLKAFQAAEKYQWVNAFGHSNATERPHTGVELLDAVKKVERRVSNKPYLDARQQTLYIGCSVQDFFADGLGSEAIRNRTSGLSLDEQAMMKARWKAGGM